MKNVMTVARIMTKMDDKASRMNKNRTVTMARMIKRYKALGSKLESLISKHMPLNATEAELDKMYADVMAWSMERSGGRAGRVLQNPVCRGKRRFLAGKCSAYRC